MIMQRMVEFETHDDLREAVAKLDNTEFKGSRVTCTAEVTVCNITPCYACEPKLAG